MHVSTSAQRDENRLTDEDRERIRSRIAETLAGWRSAATTAWNPEAVDTLALERIGWHAIGCDSRDLRDSELHEISAMVARAIAATDKLPRSAFGYGVGA